MRSLTGNYDKNGKTHFLTKRFDRTAGEKKHVLNFSAMGHYEWNPPGHVSYENLFGVMRALNIPYAEQEEQFRRMVFNVLARNTDDHVKQFSFMMSKTGEWHISPAYDLTFSYDPDDYGASKHKLTINDKQEDFDEQDFYEFADNAGINKYETIIKEVGDAIAMWPDFAKTAGLGDKTAKLVHNQHLNASDFLSSG